MTQELQKETQPGLEQPPLSARDKTHGERLYDLIFNRLLNFWVNLFGSSLFTFAMFQYKNPIKLGARSTTTENLLGRVEHFFDGVNKFFGQKDPLKSASSARAMTEVMMLQIPGTLVIVPSMWLGAKIKPAFVRFFDRRHYGKDAESDPTIAARHDMIDHEARPTFLGAMVARLATLGVSHVAASTVGRKEHNYVNMAGEKFDIDAAKNFQGINATAGEIGSAFGDVAVRFGPVKKLNDRMKGPAFGFSNEQLKEKPELASVPFNHSVQSYLRYVSMDVLYTWLCAGAVHPIFHLIRHIPGMSYKPQLAEPPKYKPTHVPHNFPVAAAVVDNGDAPRTQVSDVAAAQKLQPQAAPERTA